MSSPLAWSGALFMIASGLIASAGPVLAEQVAIPRTWQERTPPIEPPNRAQHGMAYDAARGRTVMFGGTDDYSGGSAPFGDTWIWDGQEWELVPTGDNRPSARRNPNMAYDPERDQVVLFGGSGFWDDTWVFADDEWTQLFPPSSPPDDHYQAMAWDPNSERVILFGGTLWYKFTWAWDGTTWTELALDRAPPGRQGAELAYDAGRGGLVLFGGYRAGRYLDDTWLFTGTRWKQLDLRRSPLARTDFAMSSSGHRVALVGGRRLTESYRETWVLGRHTWRLLPLETQPATRSNSAMVWDAARREAVLFGGFTSDDESGEHVFYDDTWTLGR